MATYDRYSLFTNDGECEIVPFITIPVKDTDQYETYRKNSTRLDILSNKYYNDSNYGWLILQANPEYGSMEFNIPDGVSLRIPYPLNATLSDYEAGVANYNEYYK